MAVSYLCSIPNCGKPGKARGWCAQHWKRWRISGDPLYTRTTAHGEPQKFLADVVLPYLGDECIAWPFAKSSAGYGQVWLDGNLKTASRVVCERVNGPPPEGLHDAAHSCGNGHLGCVTPAHMSWKTRSGNIADMIGHGRARRGEAAPFSILTEKQVLEIREMQGVATQEVIAAQFGISRKTVSKIHLRQRWGHLP